MTLTILVTHLLGSGHLARAAILARAFQAAGWRVVLISGGRPAPHLVDGVDTLVQLPSLASDGLDFRTLLDPNGDAAPDAYRTARIEQAIAALTAAAPDAVITEHFPFGRRTLAAEFEAVLAAALSAPRPPLVFASVRDILQPPSKPARISEAEARLARYYDGVLVHGDPALLPLGASWPATPAIKAQLLYTGYVAPPREAAPRWSPSPDDVSEILVAAGGGPVGDTLFEAAARASALAPERRWRLLVGGADPGRSARIARLQALAPPSVDEGPGLLVEPVRADYRALLARAAVSVSQAGYNTALDLLEIGTPAVLSPFEEGGEVEQRLRADALAGRPGFETLRSGEPEPEELLAAIARLDNPISTSASDNEAIPINLDGAARSVEIVTDRIGARPQG